MKTTKQKEIGSKLLLVILSQVFGVPWMSENESFQVLELVCTTMDGSAHTIRALPGGTQDPRSLHLGVLEHPYEDEAPVGELP